MRRSLPMHIVVLWLIQCVCAAIIAPAGNFALNDDWAYAHSVQWLLHDGRIQLSHWIAMTLLPQTLMGAGWAGVFGLTFEALRALTFLMSLLTSALIYVWFGLFTTARQAFALTLLLLATPWWWPLSLSFMTEFYSLSFMLGAAICAVQFLRTQGARWWWAMIALSVAGTLQRQVVLAVPIGFFLVLCVHAWRTPLQVVRFGVPPLVASMLALIAYQSYLKSGPGLPFAQLDTNERLFQNIGALFAGDLAQWKWAARASFEWFGYIAFACAAGVCAWLARNRLSKMGWLVAAVFTGVGLLAVVNVSGPFPFKANNVIDPVGIGPLTIVSGLDDRVAPPVPRPFVPIWWTVTFALLPVFGLVVALFAQACARAARLQDRSLLFALFVCVAYCAPLIATDFIDRYVFFILPFFAVLIANVEAPRAQSAIVWRALAIALIAIQALWSLCATHDYFAWNRARDAAIATAEAQGATPKTLDGGFEYNGWHTPSASSPHRKVPHPIAYKNWWWVLDDEWTVSFHPREGYDVVQRFRVKRWLATTPRDVVLLKRKPS